MKKQKQSISPVSKIELASKRNPMKAETNDPSDKSGTLAGNSGAGKIANKSQDKKAER
jgi:hypothetical protein